MKSILVLGAGFVAGPLVEHLAKLGYSQIVADADLPQAKRLVASIKHNLSDSELPLESVALDVTNQDALDQLITRSDLVVSLLPYTFHVKVAMSCLNHSKHLVTASYVSDDMRELHEAAKSRGLVFLNEIGLDPGIDHLSAMAMIADIRSKGEKITAFYSWCGGLPAPHCRDELIGYKFSWSPKAVLLALNNDAKYILGGAESGLSAANLVQDPAALNLSGLSLEGYPNRDSTAYKTAYGLEDAEALVRGTLRYPGFCQFVRAVRKLGLLNTEVDDKIRNNKTWHAYVSQLTILSGFSSLDDLFDTYEGVEPIFRGLGLLDDVAVPKNTPLDALSDLLASRLQYSDDETDMVLLHHEFHTDLGNHYYSTLYQEGEVGGYSAMATTVGVPAAIAADLILRGEIKRPGVQIPVTPDIYLPILQALKNADIEMQEGKLTQDKAIKLPTLWAK